MLIPEKMTELTIFINQQLIPVFMSDIAKIRNFHIEKIEDDYEDSENDDSILDAYNVSSIINKEDFSKFMEKTELIKHYIYELLKKGNIDPDKVKIPSEDKRVRFEFNDYQSFITELSTKVEELYHSIDKSAKNIKKLNSKLKNLAIMVSLINMIYKFGGTEYKESYFKYLHFDLYTTSEEQYNDFKNAAELLKSPLVLYGEEIGPKIYGFFVFYEKVYEDKFENLFITYNCKKRTISDEYISSDGIDLDKIKSNHDELIKSLKIANESYEELIDGLPQKILAYYETLENIITIINIIKEFHHTSSRNIVKISGFIPTRIKDDAIKALKAQFKTNIRIESKDIERKNPYEEKKPEVNEENESEEEEKHPPTLIIRNKLAKPFGGLVKLYGTANYSEIDPSIFLTLTFPIIFGLMFGDFGHGVSLSIVGLIAAIKLSKTSKPKMYTAIMFILCGFGAMLGGLLYGESFGGHLNIGGQHIVLFASPIENITLILKLSVIIGVIILCIGWVLKFINLWINKRKFLGFADPLIKIIMIIGGTKLLLTYQFDIAAWIAPPEPILLVVIPSLILVVMKPIGKIFGISYLKEESFGALLGESVMDFAESMLQIISNVASFVRILALEMAHLGLMIVILEINGMIGDSILGIYILHPIVLVIGNAFVIVLELILVMIHALRLHFYEFFSKFYVADGYPFDPILISEKYSEFTFVNLPNIDNYFEFSCNF